MVMTDLTSDMLTRIRNAQGVNKFKVDTIPSKLNIEVANILKEEGYVKDVKLVDGDKGFKMLRIALKYDKNEKAVIKHIRRLSKPGRRLYVKAEEITKTLNGLGISIISTSKGVVTGQKARELNIGGEMICEVW